MLRVIQNDDVRRSEESHVGGWGVDAFGVWRLAIGYEQFMLCVIQKLRTE